MAERPTVEQSRAWLRSAGRWVGAVLLPVGTALGLDLLPILRREAANGRLYYERNTHWNERGDALVARLLAGQIEAILPAR